MALSVQTNNAAMTALKHLNTNNANMNQSLERLSSGFRINSAADDAAGYAISSKLDAQTTRLKAASQNVTQGQAMVKMADAGVNEIQNMIVRLESLAVQGASANNSNDLAKLDAERIKLESQIDKIANGTNYNGTNLLNGINASAVAGTVTQTTAGDGSVTSLTTTEATDGGVSTAYSYTTAASAAVAHVAATVGTVTDNNTQVATVAGTPSFATAATATFTVTSTDNAGAFTVTNDVAVYDNTGAVALAAGAVSTSAEFTAATGLTVTIGTNAAAAGETSTFATATNGTVAVAAGAAGDTLTVTGADGSTGTASLTAGGAFSVTMSNTAVLTGTAAATLADSTVTGVTTVTADAAAGAAYAGALSFQVGADNNANNRVDVDLSNSYTTTGLSLSGDLLSQANAQAYIDTAKAALDTLTTQRADLGATQNQLSFVASNLATSIEQASSAVSSIRDADMAMEMADFTKNQVLTQASTSMLAQANQSAQNVLTLFR